MKITQEVREFARLNPPPSGDGDHPKDGEGASREDAKDAKKVSEAEAQAGMAEMSKRFHDAGSELYLPAEGAAESEVR